MKINIVKTEIIEKITLSIILFIALVLRLIPALRLEFWYDEAFTFFTREVDFWDLIFYDPPHPPFFFWFVKGWSQINTSQFFLRLPAVISSLGSTYLIFKICKNLNLNKYFALISSLFFGLHIAMIEEGFEFRMYGLVILLMLLSFFSVFKILQSQKRWLVVFCMSNFFGILTDYAFVWYFISLFAGYLVAYWLSCFIKFKDSQKIKNLYLMSGFILSICLMLLWFPVFMTNFKEAFNYNAHLFGDLAFSLQRIHEVDKLLFFVPHGFGNYTELIFYLLLLFSIFGHFLVLKLCLSSKKIGIEKIFFWITVGLFFYFSRNIAINIGWFLPHIIYDFKPSLAIAFFPILSLSGIISILLNKKNHKKIIGAILLLGLTIVCIRVYLTSGIFENQLFYRQIYSFKDSAEYFRREADLARSKLFFIKSWESTPFNYFFYGYDRNQYNLNLVYNLGDSWDINLQDSGKTYWLVNVDNHRLEQYKTEEEKIIYGFFSKCGSLERPIYYKKAILYKCQI